jgi:S-adenosylmethionine:tRNA ribosyltransferase-isomerase
VLVSEFDFELPPELIAQEPLADRAASRMLTLNRATGAVADCNFRDLPALLQPGDLLVFNNSRVIPARLYGQRTGLHTQPGHHATGRVQVMLTEQLSQWEWLALVRPGRKVLTGEVIRFGDSGLQAEVIAHGEHGERTIRFQPVPDFYTALDRTGHIPLPPYIHREDRPEDRERYQTVYSQQPGSVAAPTAGLHFTPEILAALANRGVQTAYVTLHVGLGTFAPVRVSRVEDIHLHRERYTLPPETAAAINAALRENRRVIAVGTTTVRTLEHCAAAAVAAAESTAQAPSDPVQLTPHSGETHIFISPGYKFRVIQGLLTNFHLPQSTLLMLVSAFAGREHTLAAYRHAVHERYRFFSYGDCMFIY